jgi:hypothetical protein
MNLLKNLTEITGLHINVHKSGSVLIAIPEQYISIVASLTGWQPQQLSIKYVGLPLTYKKPTSAIFDPQFTTLKRRIYNMNYLIITK